MAPVSANASIIFHMPLELAVSRSGMAEDPTLSDRGTVLLQASAHRLMNMTDMGRRAWVHQGVDSSIAWIALQWISAMTTVLLVIALGAFLLYVVIRGFPTASSRRARVSGMSRGMQVVLALTMLVDYSCTDQYQPNIPAMAKVFKVSPTEMGFTIQIHLLFCALGMTVVGPLSDRIGRRPVILACQLMQAISTVTCMCASSIGWFMAGRAIQGLAASVYVAILASMRDCFDDAASRQRAMGGMMSLMLIGPIFAPAVGGYLASDFGWRLPFGLLSIFAVALAYVSYHVIHETAPAHEEANNWVKDVSRTLSCRRRLLILVCVGTTKSLFDVVISSNGYILERHFGQTLKETSGFTAMFAMACALGSVVAGRLHQEPTDVLRFFTPLMVFSALALIVAGISDNIVWYLSSICFLQFVVFPPIIAYHAEFTRDLEDIAGTATSLDLCAQYFLSSLLSIGGLHASASGASGMLFVLAGTVLVTEILTWCGIANPVSSKSECDPLIAYESTATKTL